MNYISSATIEAITIASINYNRLKRLRYSNRLVCLELYDCFIRVGGYLDILFLAL